MYTTLLCILNIQVIGTFQITHDEIHYKKPIPFSENVPKLTYGNVELKTFSRGITPRPHSRPRGGDS